MKKEVARKIKKKLFLFCFFSVFFTFTLLNAVSIERLSETDQIIQTNTISLYVSFDPSDYAVYADSLRFSLDVPVLTLKRWKSSVKPTQHYVLSFRQNKLLHTRSFAVELTCAYEQQSSQDQEIQDQNITTREAITQALKNAHLSVACLIVDRNDRNRSKHFVVPLYDHVYDRVSDHEKKLVTHDALSTVLAHNESAKNTYTHDTLVRKKIPPNLTEPIDESFAQLTRVWQQARDFCNSTFERDTFMSIFHVILSLFLILWLAWVLRMFCFHFLPVRITRFLSFKSFPLFKSAMRVWEKELRLFITFLFCASFFYFAFAKLNQRFVMGAFTTYVFCTSLYYLWTTSYSDSFLGKLKVVIGMILLVLVLPLLLKTYLLALSEPGLARIF